VLVYAQLLRGVPMSPRWSQFSNYALATIAFHAMPTQFLLEGAAKVAHVLNSTHPDSLDIHLVCSVHAQGYAKEVYADGNEGLTCTCLTRGASNLMMTINYHVPRQ
jgi:hypothetical protein